MTTTTTAKLRELRGDEPIPDVPRTPGRIGLIRWASFGWSAEYMPDDGARQTLSHYAETWRSHLDECVAGALIVDLRISDHDEGGPMNYDALATLTMAGPLVTLTVPRGMVDGIGGGLRPFSATSDVPRRAECMRLGNAGAFDTVSPETFAELARSYGARIYVVTP